MGAWAIIKRNIRKQETPFYAFLYKLARKASRISFPVIPGVHAFLYREWVARTHLWHSFWRVVYYEPMFKSQCRKVGSGLRIEYAGNGAPKLNGYLDIYFGNDITMFDNTALVGVSYSEKSELHVGSRVYLGPACRIMVAKLVSIGDYTILGNRTMVVDNAGKPVDPAERLIPGGGRSPAKTVKPVTIGSHCMIGVDCFIAPGTVVRDGVFSKPNTHMRGYVPPFCVVEGNPWRISTMLPINSRMREQLGEETYHALVKEQKEYCEKHNIPVPEHGAV